MGYLYTRWMIWYDAGQHRLHFAPPAKWLRTGTCITFWKFGAHSSTCMNLSYYMTSWLYVFYNSPLSLSLYLNIRIYIYVQYIQTTASEHLKTQAGWKQTICLKRPQLTSVIELQDTTNHQFWFNSRKCWASVSETGSNWCEAIHPPIPSVNYSTLTSSLRFAGPFLMSNSPDSKYVGSPQPVVWPLLAWNFQGTCQSLQRLHCPWTVS